jgi:hypothetical protein
MKKLLVGLALGALVVPHLTCSQAILTATPGSTLSLFANPEFIAANGDISSISALIVEPNGTVVPDGTVVQFFTNLGRVDAQGKTSDGIAHVNLVSDSRSGDAEVTAVSGGSAPATTPTTTLAPAAFGNVADPTAFAAASTGTNAASITVHIGSGRPASVQVTANPPRITGLGPARQSRLVANVFDDNGNQVSNVPVIFTITADSSQTETLASGSSPIYTDTSGQAVDYLQTKYDPEAASKAVTVTATTSNGKTGTVQVQIN